MPLYTRSLKIRETALGPDHPDVATALNNLVGLFKVQVGCEELPVDTLTTCAGQIRRGDAAL